jgi:hypothetical protein
MAFVDSSMPGLYPWWKRRGADSRLARPQTVCDHGAVEAEDRDTGGNGGVDVSTGAGEREDLQRLIGAEVARFRVAISESMSHLNGRLAEIERRVGDSVDERVEEVGARAEKILASSIVDVSGKLEMRSKAYEASILDAAQRVEKLVDDWRRENQVWSQERSEREQELLAEVENRISERAAAAGGIAAEEVLSRADQRFEAAEARLESRTSEMEGELRQHAQGIVALVDELSSRAEASERSVLEAKTLAERSVDDALRLRNEIGEQQRAARAELLAEVERRGDEALEVAKAEIDARTAAAETKVTELVEASTANLENVADVMARAESERRERFEAIGETAMEAQRAAQQARESIDEDRRVSAQFREEAIADQAELRSDWDRERNAFRQSFELSERKVTEGLELLQTELRTSVEEIRASIGDDIAADVRRQGEEAIAAHRAELEARAQEMTASFESSKQASEQELARRSDELSTLQSEIAERGDIVKRAAEQVEQLAEQGADEARRAREQIATEHQAALQQVTAAAAAEQQRLATDLQGRIGEVLDAARTEIERQLTEARESLAGQVNTAQAELQQRVADAERAAEARKLSELQAELQQRLDALGGG